MRSRYTFTALSLATVLGTAVLPTAAQAGGPIHHPMCPIGEHKVCLRGEKAPNCTGGCVGDPPPVVTVEVPAYIVSTILYAPPGRKSSVDYGAGSTTGTHFEKTETVESGIVTQVTVPGGELDAKALSGASGGASWEITKSDAVHWILMNGDASAANDQIDHTQDTFVLTVNGEWIRSEYADGHKTEELSTSDGAPMRVLKFTVSELANGGPMSEEKAAFFATLTPTDRLGILKLDPWFGFGMSPSFQPALDPARFAKIGSSIDMTGPDHLGDVISGDSHVYGYDSTKGTISGNKSEEEKDMLIGGECDFTVFKAGVKTGMVTQYEYEDRTESTVGQQQEFTALLATSTVCFSQSFDLYWDAAFASYAFVPVGPVHNACTEPAPVAGILRNVLGQPMVNMEVTATLPDGSHRTAFTNAQGYYRMFDTGMGAVTANPNARSLVVRQTVISAGTIPHSIIVHQP